MTARTCSVPRVSTASTPDEVARAAALALGHPLFARLSRGEQTALRNPRANIRKAHAILVKMKRLESASPTAAPSAAKIDVRQSSAIADRRLADAILADELLCWAITSSGRQDLLRRLRLSKPALVRQALEELDQHLGHFRELVDLRCALCEAACDIVDERTSSRQRAAVLKSLWADAFDVICWLDRYENEMTPEDARLSRRLTSRIYEYWFDAEVLPGLIAEADALLGRHVGRRSR